jgi:hypothetical protein
MPGIAYFLASIHGTIVQLDMQALENMESKSEKAIQFRLERLELQTHELNSLIAGSIDKTLEEKENTFVDLPRGAKQDKYGIYDPTTPNKPGAFPEVSAAVKPVNVSTFHCLGHQNSPS